MIELIIYEVNFLTFEKIYLRKKPKAILHKEIKVKSINTVAQTDLNEIP